MAPRYSIGQTSNKGEPAKNALVLQSIAAEAQSNGPSQSLVSDPDPFELDVADSWLTDDFDAIEKFGEMGGMTGC